MPSAPNPTIRFLRAVHRRHVLLRCLEHGGIGLLVGGFLALAVLLTAAVTGGQPIAMWMMATATLGGGLLGMAAGWVRRPSMLDSAMQADRQLDMTDLLSTAWSLRRANDPWARQILICADVRCHGLSPAAVLLGRWGKRGWGSVALVSLLMLCASLLVEQSENTRAANNPADVSQSLTAPSPAENTATTWYTPASPVYRSRSLPDEATESPANQSTLQSEPDSQPARSPDAQSPSTASQINSHDAGAGMARTPSKQNMPLPSLGQSTNQSRPSVSNGSANGGSMANHSASPAGPSTADGSLADRQAKARPELLWTTTTDAFPSIFGPFDLQANPQYQPYSDMIRQYFQRD
jgi:hypothetical protein